MHLFLLDEINIRIILLCYLNTDVLIQFIIVTDILVIQRNMDSFGYVKIEIFQYFELRQFKEVLHYEMRYF